MDVRLLDIIGVEPGWESVHVVRALSVDGKSPALEGLLDLERNHRDDYKKIMKVIRLVAGNQRVINPKHVKQGDTFKEVYEMRGGHARLFFFYTPDAEQIVVCANHYWKAREGEREQDTAFERCNSLRLLYTAHVSSGARRKACR